MSGRFSSVSTDKLTCPDDYQDYIGPIDPTPPKPTPWLFDRMIARGYMTLLAGPPKAGKTTLVMGIIHRIEAAGGAVVIASEEPEQIWAERFHRIGLPLEAVNVYKRSPVMMPGRDDWTRLVERVTRHCENHATDLVVIDTIAGVGPIEDENNAPEVTRAITPLRAISETGAALLVIHHTRKPGEKSSGWQAGTRIRGSSAFSAAVDIIAELSQYSQGPDDRRRKLAIHGRPHDCNGERCFEIDELGQIAGIEDASEAGADKLKLDVLDKVHSAGPGGIDRNALREALKADHLVHPGRSTLNRVLSDLEDSGRLTRQGDGVKGKPFLYVHPEFVSSHEGGCME